MRGITEERLNEILNDPEGDEFELEKEFLKFLIDNECKELNAWQPIETIDWEIEEGCYEYENDQEKSQISIMGRNNVYMHGEFNFNEIQSVAAKLKELPEDPV